MVLKIFQYFNGFVLAQIFTSNGGSLLAFSSLAFVLAIFFLGFLLKKVWPQALSWSWIFVVLTIGASSLINLSLPVAFISGLFLYALIGAEAQVFKTIEVYKKIPRPVLLIFSLVPALFLLFPVKALQVGIVSPWSFYVVSTVFAFLASYSAEIYGGGRFISQPKGQKSMPIWFGLIFMIGAGLLYIFTYVFSYLDLTDLVGISSTVILAPILGFYAAGAMSVYISIDASLRGE